MFQQPIVFVLVAVALVICLTIHEFAHAYVAHKLGDDTAKLLGRVTLNPLAHLDPIGTVMLLFAGIGWGKPVPFNPYNLKNPKRDGAIIAIAGPASNFVLAIILTILFKLFADISLIGIFLYTTISYNIILAVFNLIPLHPLDGFKVVNGFLPENLSIQWLQIAPYGIWVLILMIVTGTIQNIISPAVNSVMFVLGLPPI